MTPLAKLIADLIPPPGQLAMFWLGGAGFVLKAANAPTVAIDPYLSDSLDRFYSWKRLPFSPISMAPEDLHADLVLTTHAHEDHLDPETIPGLAQSSAAVFVGPGMCAQRMREWGVPEPRIVQLDRGERREVLGVEVAAVLAHHVSNAGAQTPDAVGYLVDVGGIRVYHSGDTLLHPDLKEIRSARPDLMLVCINGGYGNMNPAEAADLTAAIDPAVVVPMHWGLVAENTTNPALFVRALAGTGSSARPLVMAPGDCVVSSFGRIPAS
jgi:L-ascorbate 6-phosphate lactonase